MNEMQHHSVTGGGGVPLHVVEAGNPSGPSILFVHGWSQGAAAWSKQLKSPLLKRRFRMVALDLRGHGDSGKPDDAYGNSRHWAEDIAAVMRRLFLRTPVLVGWSYGGYVIDDYLRAHGDGAIAAINFVAAASDMGIEVAYRQRGDGWSGVLPRTGTAEPHAFSPAPDDAAPMRTYVRNIVSRTLPPADEEALVALNLCVPPEVRRALFARTLANDDVLAAIRVPVLVTHGERDRIVDVETARHIAATVPGAQLSLYPDSGHAPFLEEPARFERELASFVDVAVGALR